MSYYKKQQDNSVSVGETIYGPDFTLDETTIDQSHDGWKWFDTPEAAYAYFSNSTDDVTPRQFRLSLLNNGINPSVITDMLKDNESALIEWEYTTSISKSNPLIYVLADALNKTEDDVNEIFNQAKNL